MIYMWNALKGRFTAGFRQTGGKVIDFPTDHALRLQAYEDATYGLTLYNGNRVGAWKDTEGRFGWGQGDNAKRPFYDSDNTSPNGKYIVHYPGGDYVNHNVSDAEEFISGTNGQTIIVVGGNWTADSDHVFSMCNGSANHRTFRLRTEQYSIQPSGGTQNSNYVASFTRPSGWFILRASWEPGTKTRVYKDGDTTPIAESPLVVPSVDLDIETVKLCANDAGDSSLNDGDIAEIIVYKRDISDYEWYAIYHTLYAEWFI